MELNKAMKNANELALGESIAILEKAGAKVQLMEDTDELPVNIRRVLKESTLTVYPASNKNYSISFTQADIFWWSEKFKNEFIVIRPIDEIKKAIRLALINVVDKYTRVVKEKDFEMSKLVEELLAEK